MAEIVSFARPPIPLEISTGNPAHSWGKWKQKFEIYLKAVGAEKKPDKTKVGLLLDRPHRRAVFGNLLKFHLLTRA